MFQVGEFSFLLARVGIKSESISSEIYSLVLATAVVTMILTPFVSAQTSWFYSLKKRRIRKESFYHVNIPEKGLRDHVVIAGGGRMGLQVANVLQQLDTGFVLIDIDHRCVERAKEAKLPIVFGDATQEIVLEAAGLRRACLLLVTTADPISIRSVIRQARALRSDLDIVSRAVSSEHAEELKEQGVLEIVQPEMEAGLEMTRQALLHLNVAPDAIQRFSDVVRRGLGMSADVEEVDRDAIAELVDAEQRFGLDWIELSDGSSLTERTIGELQIRTRTGATIVGVMRRKELKPNPGPETKLVAGDRIAVIGTASARRAIRNLAGLRSVSQEP
jgi:CPA2 family monovalent cation:H+ antiporter-2